MKKIGISLMTLMFVGMTFSSCTKDYTCTCTLDYVDNSLVEDQVVEANYTGVKKSDAEESCDAADTAGNNGLDASIASYSCELTTD